MSMAESYHWTPQQCRDLTLHQVHCIAQGAAKTDEETRYRQMSHEVREKALSYKRQFGEF